MKKFTLLASLVVGISSLFSCGGGGGDDEPDVPSDPIPEFSYRTFTVNGVNFEFAAVDGGSFSMGGTEEQGSLAYDNELPVHKVTLSDFFIGKTEVTQAQWKAVMGSDDNPSEFKHEQRPVESLSWKDCNAFINKLNTITGMSFRLPTEAEWEYAARGGAKTSGFRYSGSNNVSEVAWYNSPANPETETHQVAQKKPNELGLYDMSGNVAEWCNDEWGLYSSAPQTNPTGPSTGSAVRVQRGGSWKNYSRLCRTTYRTSSGILTNDNTSGFRIAFSK